MREIFTYGSVGGAPGNRCFYPDIQYQCGIHGLSGEVRGIAGGKDTRGLI